MANDNIRYTLDDQASILLYIQLYSSVIREGELSVVHLMVDQRKLNSQALAVNNT
jgi:hypothetical protein